jgi:hypothetical protein
VGFARSINQTPSCWSIGRKFNINDRGLVKLRNSRAEWAWSTDWNHWEIFSSKFSFVWECQINTERSGEVGKPQCRETPLGYYWTSISISPLRWCNMIFNSGERFIGPHAKARPPNPAASNFKGKFIFGSGHGPKVFNPKVPIVHRTHSGQRYEGSYSVRVFDIDQRNVTKRD